MNTTHSTANYRMPSTRQTRLFAPNLAALTFRDWQQGIVRAPIRLPLGYTRSKEYAAHGHRLNQASETGTTILEFCATKCRTFWCRDFPLQTFETKLPRRVDYRRWTTGQATGMCSAICPTICVKGSYTKAHAARLSISPVVPPFARYISTA
jgi:hypothetical protein